MTIPTVSMLDRGRAWFPTARGHLLAGLLLLLAACSNAGVPVEPRGREPGETLRQLGQSGSNTARPEQIVSFRTLPRYSEPSWVTREFVARGLLPPLTARLPRVPLVFEAAAFPDGMGVYGDVLRQVTGGRPEGWNYNAGQSQGWGGIDIGQMECLTRTGPLFMVATRALQPLPNLARSWSWSADGRQLTMKLVEGARWSDGVPFTSDDVMFFWTDNVLDPNVSPLGGAGPDSFGVGTTLTAVDAYTIRWTFRQPFPEDVLYQMAYGRFCPGPAHILRPQHPRYNKRNSYTDYKNAFPPERVNFPVMGAWVVTEYRPDELLVLRRNPYYWKVDAAGQQLPYFDEVQYRLLGWADRETQVIAGASDLANVENPANYVEVLKQAAKPTAPFRMAFGPRNAAYALLLNLSGNGWGEPDARGQAVRLLNRTLAFRQAVDAALDRRMLADALLKGPIIQPYFGGLLPETPFNSARAGRDPGQRLGLARRLLDGLGLVDRDGDGLRNYPDGMAGGANVTIVLTASPETVTDRTLAEGIQINLREVGIRVILRFVGGTQRDALGSSGQFDWTVGRNNTPELITAVQGSDALAPIGPYTFAAHKAGRDGRLDLLPFERELIAVVERFTGTRDAVTRQGLMRRYQQLVTGNVATIGLFRFPGALVINRRVAGVVPGTPTYMFNWSEDAVMRERLFVPRVRQGGFERRPHTLPGRFEEAAR